MRNKSFTRFLCMVLAMMCIIGGGSVAVSAGVAQTKDTITDKTIADYKETLDTISYEEYQLANFKNAVRLSEEIRIALTDNWVFRNGDVAITMKNGTWTMYVLGKAYASLDAGLAAGYTADQLYVDGKAAYVIDDTILTTDEAVEKGYKLTDIAYVEDNYGKTAEYEGKRAIITPGQGKITWDISTGLSAATLVSIGLDYFPIEDDSPSVIERELYINGVAPYSEARALRLSQIWSSFQQGSKRNSKKLLEASYTLGKKESMDDVVADALAVGFTADDYKISGNTITFVQPSVLTAGLSNFISKYELRFFATDISGNELRPTQLQDSMWTSYILADSDGFSHSYADMDGKYDSNYFGFVIKPDANGKIQITLDGVNEPMALSEMSFLPFEATISYEQYYNDTTALVGNAQGGDIIKIEAENTTHTSTNVVYPIEDRTSPLSSPADTTRTVLNTIGTEKWSTAGQWAEYDFSVGSAGWYDIYARFKQSYLDGMYVSRALSIYTDMTEEEFVAKYGNTAGYYDGIPFAEAANLRYDYGTGWQVTKLSDQGGDDKDTYQIYFREGVVYTVRLTVTLGSMSDQVRKIESILNTLNTCYLDIIKLTGTTPDDYRNYNFYRVLPTTMNNMVQQKRELEAISRSLRENSGVASTYTGICDKLVDLLDRMVQDGGDPIAKNLDTFKSYVGSLGTFLTDAKTQPLQLDFLLIQPSTEKAPKGQANIFQTFWHEVLCFIQSFFRDYNSMGATEEITDKSKVVSVWVPYGRDQANVIRNLSTNGFTQEYGTSVDLKLVTAGTLLPSILAGMGPDVYIGLDQALVINYAIRGALTPIENMDGFQEEILDKVGTEDEIFNNAAMTVLGIADADGVKHYYGLPENQGFSMMFVRLDILADLDIEIPRTWDDLYKAQTVLQSNNMEIGVNTEYKFFLYQMGGDLWADNGMRINLDSQVGLKAFSQMCDMFTQNSFPYTYDAANRFRTGEMPIVIAGYTGLYNQLKVFATELDGCWTFVPVPGTIVGYDENGKEIINNESISSVTAVVMIKDAKNQEEAWNYMKWYSGAECQSDYANEMVALIGDSAKHSTGNSIALKSMPWTTEEIIEITKQFNALSSVENYPGYYYIDRYTNFAFLAAYNDGADPSAEILSYINTINTEITRKRQEFKLETLELGQTLAEKRTAQAREALDYLEDTFNGDGAYTAAIRAARYALDNGSEDKEDCLLLQSTSVSFDELLQTKWNGDQSLAERERPYYVNIGKQTMEKKNGGYAIDSLNELKLLFFISEALENVASAYESYRTV